MKLDASIGSLETSLDLRLKRQGLLASNLANIDTPNYQPQDLQFDGYLADQMDGTADVKGSSAVVEKPEGSIGLDGNGVDLDAQVSRLTDNSMRFNTALELIRRKMALIRYASTEGRG